MLGLPEPTLWKPTSSSRRLRVVRGQPRAERRRRREEGRLHRLSDPHYRTSTRGVWRVHPAWSGRGGEPGSASASLASPPLPFRRPRSPSGTRSGRPCRRPTSRARASGRSDRRPRAGPPRCRRGNTAGAGPGRAAASSRYILLALRFAYVASVPVSAGACSVSSVRASPSWQLAQRCVEHRLATIGVAGDHGLLDGSASPGHAQAELVRAQPVQLRLDQILRAGRQRLVHADARVDERPLPAHLRDGHVVVPVADVAVAAERRVRRVLEPVRGRNHHRVCSCRRCCSGGRISPSPTTCRPPSAPRSPPATAR